MAVHCTKCGEELLGAVNRCWRCGRTFAPSKGAHDVPPVRRSPPPAALATAEVVGEEVSDTAEPIRRGSPFAESKQKVDSPSSRGPDRPATAAAHGSPLTTRYPTHLASAVGALLSFLLGLLSLFIAFAFPTGALITAAAGVGMGCWGLYSERRGLAIAGLLASCIALAVAGFNAAVDLYTFLHGVPPWQPVDPALDP
jgi:hypothetical protein